jgi:hypothetical protein
MAAMESQRTADFGRDMQHKLVYAKHKDEAMMWAWAIGLGRSRHGELHWRSGGARWRWNRGEDEHDGGSVL